jgi:DNA repair exonuclease SbcCD ATPase subunit
LRQFQRELLQKKDDLEKFVASFTLRLKGVKGLNFANVVSYKIDIAPVKSLIDELRNQVSGDRKLISEQSVKDNTGAEMSLVVRLAGLEDHHKKLQSKLDEPNRKYEAYKKAEKQWKESAIRITGTSATPDTLKYFEAQEKYIEKTLNKAIAEKRKARIDIVIELYGTKCEIIEIYSQVKQFIDNVISRNRGQLGDYRINIVAEFSLSNDIVPRLLGYISKNVVGTYHGAESAEKVLLSLIEKIDVNKIENVIELCDQVIMSLEKDGRTEALEPRYIDNQIEDPVSFYDYLFSLDYLLENYELRLGEKKLEKLSPGEKGALLIVFYLLLDKSETPLVLDQPEDNLDNESVSQILVPFIKEAKRRRQIIMVTHNPNLAVYADAEQVIRTRIDKEGGNVFICSSGGIENSVIRQDIINVLEGTMPAFENRSRKYARK